MRIFKVPPFIVSRSKQPIHPDMIILIGVVALIYYFKQSDSSHTDTSHDTAKVSHTNTKSQTSISPSDKSVSTTTHIALHALPARIKQPFLPYHRSRSHELPSDGESKNVPSWPHELQLFDAMMKARIQTGVRGGLYA